MVRAITTPAHLTRRQTLSLSAALGGVALLAGCSSSSGKPSAAKATALTGDSGTVSLLTWETYDDQPWLDEYKKKTGVTVGATTIGSGDEAFAKAQSGSIKADIIIVDSSLTERFARSNLIAPIGLDRLKNVGKITGGLKWRKGNTYGGKLYAVPYNWGTQPLMYNASVITTPPDSWGALWDPKYKGKVVLFDAADVTIPMVALYVGVKDPYNLTDADMAKVRTALKKLRPQVRTIAKGFDDAVNIFAAGDGVIGYCQNISEVGVLNKSGKNFAYAFPKEGTPQWTDNSFITPAGQRKEVYDFIDATLAPAWQARFIETSTNNGILSTAEAKSANISAKTLKETNLLDQNDSSFWSKMSPLQAPESITKRLALWNDFKAGG